MNDENMTGNGNGMDDIGRLIRYAGEREQVSAERIERARDRVGDHWQGVVSARRGAWRKARLSQLAVAASLVVAVAAAVVLSRPVTEHGMTQVASADRVLGDVLVNGSAVETGAAIGVDATLETGIGGRLAANLESGQSLRLDSETRLVVLENNRFVLDYGRVYFDSNRIAGAAPVFIETRYGTATDIGTQYLVHVASGYLTVGVREGEVRLDRESGQQVAIEDGTLFEVSADGDERREELASTDPMWDWTASIVPVFDIDGVSLKAYLEWYARERGLQLDWADDSARSYAERTALSGSIKGLSLEQGLEVVRKIAPFRHQLSGDVLLISTD